MRQKGHRHIALLELTVAGDRVITSAKRRGYRVTVFTGLKQERFAPTRRVLARSADVDAVVEVEDVFDFGEIARVVASVDSRQPFSSIVPLFDNTVFLSCKIAANLGLVHSSLAAVETCRNKLMARRRLASSGLSSIRFAGVQCEAEIEEAARHVGFPMYFKPTCGGGSLFAKLVRTLPELNAVYQEFLSGAAGFSGFSDVPLQNETIVEQALEGPLVSAEVAAARGQIWVMAIGERKRWKENQSVELGTRMPSATLSDSQTIACAEYARKVVDCLKLDTGIFHIEMISTPSGPCLVEANPRLMGGSGPFLLSEHLGRDVCDLLIDLFEGNQVDFPGDCQGKTSVMSHFLASTVDMVSSFDPGDLLRDEELKSHLVSFHLDIKPGDLVRAVASNFDYFGQYQMRADSPKEAEQLVEGFHGRLSERLGIPLAF